jgi:hypothetical protein
MLLAKTNIDVSAKYSKKQHKTFENTSLIEANETIAKEIIITIDPFK